MVSYGNTMISSPEKHDMGHTKATKHKIVLEDPDTPLPMVQRCCPGEKEGRIAPFLH